MSARVALYGTDQKKAECLLGTELQILPTKLEELGVFTWQKFTNITSKTQNTIRVHRPLDYVTQNIPQNLLL